MKAVFTNFQSLGKCEFEFDGFTVVTGPSNFGKSAVIRALGSLLYNNSHPNWVKKGNKTYEVKVGFDDIVIEYTKGKKDNTYTVKRGEEIVEHVPKVGTGVPKVFSSYGLVPLKTERGSEYNLNISYQLDPMFMVSETPAEITSIMNAVFGTVRYERAQRSIAQEIIAVVQESNKYKDTIVEKKREQEQLLNERKEVVETKHHLDSVMKVYESAEEVMTDLRDQKMQIQALKIEEKQKDKELSVIKDLEQASYILKCRVHTYASLLEGKEKMAQFEEVRQSRESEWDKIDVVLGELDKVSMAMDWMKLYQMKQQSSLSGRRFVYYEGTEEAVVEFVEEVEKYVDFVEAVEKLEELEEEKVTIGESITSFAVKIDECLEVSQEVLCDVCPMRLEG